MRVAALPHVAFVGLAIGCVLLLLVMWRWAQRRVRSARQAERAAEERRDRFLRVAAAELEAPPFTDQGPPVILRASPVLVRAERGRLANGLKVLLWTLRRESDASAAL